MATFQITSSGSDEYDDLSDLNSHEMESMREWEMQFKEKYYLVGRLLKPGEKPTNYSDEDEDTPTDSSDVRKRTAAATKATEGSTSNAAAAAASPSTESASHQKAQSVDGKAPGDGNAASSAGTESDKPKAE
uniref:Cytochrome b5 heme-binding domain-containing protein n=1 Tax=Anopheles maculatus TaxID=74869 RepID=A0A182SZN1_9DIPT